jgi:hypothetical protein
MWGGLAIIMLLGGPAGLSPPPACVTLLSDLAAGALVVRSNLAPAACAPQATPARAAFRYDAGVGLVRAARDLPAGEVVRAPPAGLVSDLAPGASLTLESAVGPVVVDRQVVVVRAIRGGGWLVRGADGRVFSAFAGELRR